MQQVIIVYEKRSKKLLAYMEPDYPVFECNIVKIPEVNVFSTKKKEGEIYVRDNKWHVNEEALFNK